jgi:hypothetical protein
LVIEGAGISVVTTEKVGIHVGDAAAHGIARIHGAAVAVVAR